MTVPDIIIPGWNGSKGICGQKKLRSRILLVSLMPRIITNMNSLQNQNIIICICTLDIGGSEKQAIYLADFLQNHLGYKVLIAALDKGNGDAIPLLNKHQLHYTIVPFKLDSKGVNLLSQLAILALKLRNLKPDIFINYTYWPNVLINTVWRLTGAKGSIWNQRDGGYGFKSYPLESLAIRNASRIVSNSTEGKQALIGKFPNIKREIQIVFNGIDLPKISKDKQSLRGIFSISANTFVCLMIANFTNVKDHITLIEAWKLFRNSSKKDNILILIGRKDVAYNAVVAKIDEMDVRETVKILDFTEDLNSIINSSNLCVFSSSNEGVPNGILECMAYSLPVVATDITGSRDALGDDYKFLVPPKSPEMFAEKIKEFAENEDLRYKVGNALKERIYKYFSMETMCNSYIQLLNSIINNER